MPAEPVVLQLTPFNQELRADRDTLELAWLPMVRTWNHPVRVQTWTVPITLHEPRHRLAERKQRLRHEQQALAPLAAAVAAWTDTTPEQLAQLTRTLPTAVATVLDRALRNRDRQTRDDWIAALRAVGDRYWVLPWLDEYLHDFAQKDAELTLRSLRHYAIAYTDRPPSSVAQDFTRGLGTPASIATELPQLIADANAYDERLDHLEPQHGELPYLALLAVTRFHPDQEWTVETLRCLLDQPMTLHVAIDIDAKPLWLQRYQADREEALRTSDAGGAASNRDRRALKKTRGAAEIQEMMENQQQLHQVRMVVAVAADSLEQLNGHITTLRRACSTWMALARPAGSQMALARYFDTTPTKQITAFAPPQSEPSHGVAVMLPIGFRRPDSTAGVLWGMVGAAPLMFDPVRDARGQKIAGHTVISGQTGWGKTTMANVLLMRMLADGYQVCFFEPQGHAAKLIDAMGRGGKRYVLTMNESLNILDIAVGRDEQGRPPAVAAQTQYVLNQLSVLLGTNVPRGDGGNTFVPYAWTALSAAIVEKALARVYAPWADRLETLRPEHTPRLADLCDALRDLEFTNRRTAELRDDVLDQIYFSLVDGPKGALYNAATTVEWDFSRDAVAYDFTTIEAGPAQILTIAKALAAVNTYVGSPHRDRSVPFCNAWDELAVTLRAAPSLAPWLEVASRAWRTFLAMVMGIDQHLSTWLDGPLRVMFDQAPNKLIFYQPYSQAETLAGLVDGLQPEHLAAIPMQQRGDYTLIRKEQAGMETNAVYQVHNAMTPREWTCFEGT